MGILRTDRVSGLGGANAITGSVFFPHDGDTGAGESGALQISNENDALPRRGRGVHRATHVCRTEGGGVARRAAAGLFHGVFAARRSTSTRLRA